MVCHCDDCQAYVQFLERSDLLDGHGGTEIVQLTPAQLTLTEGLHQLRCMRLSPKGLLRWYAGCCSTPIANTVASHKVPFAGLLAVFIAPAARADVEAALGPVIVRAFGKFARGGMPPGGHAKAPFSYIVRSLGLIGKAWLAGRHTPSPFFSATGQPVLEPRVLSREERAQLASLAP